MFQKLLAFLTVVVFVSAAGNSCKIGKVINKPVIDGTPVYWPASWNETQPAPQLEKEQSCSWYVTIPRGYYAKLIISGKTTDKDSRFQTVDSAGNLIQTTHEKMVPYYFPASKFTLAVSNEGSATFAFKVVWWPLPTEKYVDIVASIGQVINVTETVVAMEYAAPGGITLLTFPEDLKNYNSLRSTLIYDGSSLTSATYVSNLFLLNQSKKQWTSSQDGIVVVNVEASRSMNKLLIQGSVYLAGIDEIVELHPQPNSIYNGTVNAGAHMSSLVAVSDLELQMIDVQMKDDSTVSVYYGSPDAFTLDKTYTGAELKKALPLPFGGYFVQFVVSSGKAVFTFKS
ncbi:CUB-like domain-containing protein [Caenorhabditis elegans]|uniref:CUB-like domain-containing protein n=1 Tax=Caenorhabditis elegans TaxID=6239 RepID=G5EC22_CAEEL|nr:CUB-like domain-containing protein [Caenorhabditis elegans]CAB05224.1 CUB-like domain-containing protein [Caenorhabditis elegans]|eukprot:NP_502485.1 Uncharacterized protein CELE_F55G11.4 [Caenorhabditis elegans]